jgi:hypothetical protein
VVLYGCEIWPLTLREEHRLEGVWNRVLRRIFGPKTDDVTGDWRKLHNGILSTMKMEEVCSSETSGSPRITWLEAQKTVILSCTSTVDEMYVI